MKGCFRWLMYGVLVLLLLFGAIIVIGGNVAQTVTIDGVEVTVTPKPTNTPVPSPTPVDWSKAETPAYREFFRYAEEYKGKPVYFEGEIIQVMDDCYRVAVEKTNYGWDFNSVVYTCGSSDVRILEEDVVQIYGFGDGIQRYRTVLGATVEIPRIKAVRIEINEGEIEAIDSSLTSSVVTFGLGDVIDVQSHTIRLNTVQYRGNVLFADFTIENYGDSDINLSSLMSLSARKSDGTKLSQEYFDCGTSALEGKVVPGDRLRGSICWNGATPDDGIKIYYEASLLGQGAIVWDTVAGSVGAVDAPDATLKIDVYRAGNVIQIQDHTIVLNSVEFTGGVLKANFSIENSGSTDLAVSSMISFGARKRDGSSLQQEYFNCGSSLDGSVLPGDRLRGDICWKGANPGDGVKLYYESNFLSSSAIVWVVD
jgi:hypothetical protein